MKKLVEKYQKPCVFISFGSRWIFDYVQKAAHVGEGVIPVITHLNHAVKALSMMYQQKKSLKENKTIH
ncbi:MAG: hypothetical protein GF383_05785 [Candidatus Lokiarchaeota archaeon]|nr:hypothetical protein [Candidatus Lokiarchaeota archaeon]